MHGMIWSTKEFKIVSMHRETYAFQSITIRFLTRCFNFASNPRIMPLHFQTHNPFHPNHHNHQSPSLLQSNKSTLSMSPGIQPKHSHRSISSAIKWSQQIMKHVSFSLSKAVEKWMSRFSTSSQARVELIGLMYDNPEAIAAGYRTWLSVRRVKRARIVGSDAVQ